MRRIILILSVLFILSGCDAVDDMKGMFEKQAIAQELIKEKYGWDSQLGFNIDNGILSQVTVVLDANQVHGEKIGRLEVITKDVVATVFKSKPRAIYIQISIHPDE
ncbi:MAG: lipoprotein [Gammaproteobacteria bacterium]|nr:lipoprotein [Gammaproteobacteria bacterium]